MKQFSIIFAILLMVFATNVSIAQDTGKKQSAVEYLTDYVLSIDNDTQVITTPIIVKEESSPLLSLDDKLKLQQAVEVIQTKVESLTSLQNNYTQLRNRSLEKLSNIKSEIKNKFLKEIAFIQLE